MLQKLEVFALRGATEKLALEFEKGKKITLLYGENGSGKSTVCDAIELLCNGRISSLEDRGLGKTEGYWHSTGKVPTDLRVILTTPGGTWTTTLTKSKPVVIPATGQPHAEVLRRNRLQKLIADQPKTRFDTMRPFLDIDTVEASEKSLIRLIDDEKKSRETAIARIEENRVAVENFWTQAGTPGENALKWSRIETKKDTAKLEAVTGQLESLIKQINKVSSEADRLNGFNKQLDEAEDVVRTAIGKVSEEKARVSEQASDLIKLLETAREYFRVHTEPNKCPLCGSSEFIAGLPNRVETQLTGIRSFSEALRAEAETSKMRDLKQEQVSQQTDIFLDTAQALVKCVISTELPSDLKYPENLKKAVNEMQPDSSTAVRLGASNKLLAHGTAFLVSLKDSFEKQKQEKDFIQMLRRALEVHDSNYEVQKDLDILIPHLEKALVEMQAARRSFVDGILGKISTRVGELYEEIHPGEGLNKVELLLDPDKRASLEINCSFPGITDAPPGAYFSDSHLDTLGFCIWLAIAELKKTKDTILVMDDIVASTDEPHVDRLIELLYKVSNKFGHCICTTHYRPWREKYRWGWLQSGECQFIELLPWEHEKGIKHTKHLPKIDELRKLLSTEPLMAQPACASAAVILEGILDFLTQLYECSVPRRKGKATLGDLLQSIKDKLRKALRVEYQEKAENGEVVYTEHLLGPVIDELDKIAQLRNVLGCHFNDLSHHLPEKDAIHFAETVLFLADHLIDLDCGWPKTDRSGSYWANSKQTRRLHPLKQPS